LVRLRLLPVPGVLELLLFTLLLFSLLILFQPLFAICNQTISQILDIVILLLISAPRFFITKRHTLPAFGFKVTAFLLLGSRICLFSGRD